MAKEILKQQPFLSTKEEKNNSEKNRKGKKRYYDRGNLRTLSVKTHVLLCYEPHKEVRKVFLGVY